MKKFLSASIFFCVFLSNNGLIASTNMYLQLRGTAVKTSKIKLQSFQMTANQTQVLFTTQSNSKYSDEGQKFEFEGAEELKKGLKIKKISTNNHSTMYEILITEKKHSAMENSPLFLKISAN